MKFEAEIDGEVIPVDVTSDGGRCRVSVGDEVLLVDAREVADGIWSLLIDGRSYLLGVGEQNGVAMVDVAGESHAIRIEEESRYIIRTRGGKAGAGGQVLKAPMPGKVVIIEVEVGQVVRPGDGLVVLEAMKMENEFRATAAGTVTEIRVEPGQAVNPGDVLLVIAQK